MEVGLGEVESEGLASGVGDSHIEGDAEIDSVGVAETVGHSDGV